MIENKRPSFHYEIVFPDFEPSDAIRADIEKYLSKLEELFNRIISCRVSVRAPHRHQRKHNYHVHIHLEIPGEDLIVNNDSERNLAPSNMHVAIRNAFRALHRQLRRRVKSMKEHNPNPKTYSVATIKSFDKNLGYGFIQDTLGREIYFHENSLINAPSLDLKEGTKVRFLEGPGEKGTQVTTLALT